MAGQVSGLRENDGVLGPRRFQMLNTHQRAVDMEDDERPACD